LATPSVIRSNAKKYRNAEATTETDEVSGPLTPRHVDHPGRSGGVHMVRRGSVTGVEPGWEQVARLRARVADEPHASTAGLTKRRQRQEGPSGKPDVLLPHEYPSLFQYRTLMPTVGDH
jgi:hypothetical protein